MSKLSTFAVSLLALPIVACGGGGGGNKSNPVSHASSAITSETINSSISNTDVSSSKPLLSSSISSSIPQSSSSITQSSSSSVVAGGDSGNSSVSIVVPSSQSSGYISSSANSSSSYSLNSSNSSSSISSLGISSLSSQLSSAISSLSSSAESSRSSSVQVSTVSSTAQSSSVNVSSSASSNISSVSSSSSLSSSVTSSLSSVSSVISSSSLSAISSSSSLSSSSSSLSSVASSSSAISSSTSSSSSSAKSSVVSSSSQSSSLSSAASSSVMSSSASASTGGEINLNVTSGSWTKTGNAALNLGQVLSFTTKAVDDGIEFTYNGKLAVGSEIRMSVMPDTNFIASRASLQIMAVILEAPWNGQYDCWSDNGNLIANSYQTISCKITVADFNTTSAPLKISLSTKTGLGVTHTGTMGTVSVQSVTLIAVPMTASSSSVSSNTFSSSSSGGAAISSVGTSSSAPAISANISAIPISEFITVDQFGYLPELEKVAVIRDPQTGFDAAKSFTPGNNYQVFDINTGLSVANATITSWNSGQVSQASGDKTWWVDFTSVTRPGQYTLVDVTRNVRSPNFKIADNVYKDVLKHAFRYFFYQRAGFEKKPPYADARWQDNASHPQDRRTKSVDNPSVTRDMHGGWFDAGDFNKYTNWHADYIITLLQTYVEAPDVWTDDFGIPESGNGISDLIDEVRWGMDWLIKMQDTNGGVINVQQLQGASPPSAVTADSIYGRPTTSATLSAAAAFAFGAKIFATVQTGDYQTYAQDLSNRAERAWTWALANPNVVVNNNDRTGSTTATNVQLAAGNQEVNDEGRVEKKLRAAVFLFSATKKSQYNDYITSNLGNYVYWVSLWNEERIIMPLLHYANLSYANPTTANTIKSRYLGQLTAASDNLESLTHYATKPDAYRVYLNSTTKSGTTTQSFGFTWGSNRSMARKGSLFMNLATYQLGTTAQQTAAKNAAVAYLNYLHGTNPLGLVYLSNMNEVGAHRSVDQFYHTWFEHGSSQWDSVMDSAYGPPPGFLVGGPNPDFDVDACCGTNSCGGKQSMCSMDLTPPKGQPPMKSYREINESWPVNSWQITENHNDYQVSYLRLLARLTKN